MATMATDSRIAGNDPSHPVTAEMDRVTRVLLSPSGGDVDVLLMSSVIP
jgi:hypothetical protein